MLIIRKKEELVEKIKLFRDQKRGSVGFVPTMGFLHSGHGKLIEKSLEQNELTVCDIFINPLQFNDRKDFENYPQDIEKDILFLENIECDILYLPSHNDLYPPGHIARQYNFGGLEQVMEGKFRPGHFRGVAEVVRILFEIVKPDKAYFGEKDFQQLRIIEEMVIQYGYTVEIVHCPIIREHDGLAMSSRNARLTEQERNSASFIYQQLQWSVQNYSAHSPAQLKQKVSQAFKDHSLFRLEYVECADKDTLQQINSWNDAISARMFIAAYLGKVRLIDNMILF